MTSLPYKGPHPGITAILFTVLFTTGLSFVVSFTGGGHFPGPSESADTIVAYFQTSSKQVLLCAFFQFGSAVPLGILTAAFAGKLRLLGANAPGTWISVFGGFAASISLMVSSCVLWVLAYPGIAQQPAISWVLYYLMFAMGGVGYSVPLGLLMAGIAVTSGFKNLLPRWVVVTGIALAVVGQLSWLTMLFPGMLPLIPLTRFPGFIWLIIAGFMLPNAVSAESTLSQR